MKRLILILFFLPLVAAAQKALVKWSKDTIRIGDPSTLTIRIEGIKSKPQFQPLSAIVPAQLRIDSSALTEKSEVELLKPLNDTFFSKNGSSVWVAKYEITAWDTGTYVLPAMTFAFSDTTFALQPGDLMVNFTKQAVSDGLQETFVDIKEDPFWWLKKYWWLGFIPLAAIVLLIVRKKLEVKKVQLLSLKERSILTLHALKKQEYWLKDRTEDHYNEFSFLFRSFLSARFGLNLMERTSYETMQLLEKQNISRAALDRINELIALSDQVKFAQVIPEISTTERAMDKFEELIIEISPLEIME